MKTGPGIAVGVLVCGALGFGCWLAHHSGQTSPLPRVEALGLVLIGWGLIVLALSWAASVRERQLSLPHEPQSECSPVDLTPLRSRLKRVRADYVAVVRALHATDPFHGGLLCAARGAIGNLSFFCSKRSGPDSG